MIKNPGFYNNKLDSWSLGIVKTQQATTIWTICFTANKIKASDYWTFGQVVSVLVKKHLSITLTKRWATLLVTGNTMVRRVAMSTSSNFHLKWARTSIQMVLHKISLGRTVFLQVGVVFRIVSTFMNFRIPSQWPVPVLQAFYSVQRVVDFDKRQLSCRFNWLHNCCIFLTS